MKIKGTFVLREIAGETVAVPVGSEQLDSNVLVLLNETGTFIWKMLCVGAAKNEIAEAVCNEYEIDSETAQNDLNEFLEYISSKGIEITE